MTPPDELHRQMVRVDSLSPVELELERRGDTIREQGEEIDALRERLAGEKQRSTRWAAGFLSLAVTLATASLGAPLLFVAAVAAAGCGAVALVDK